MSSSRSPSIGSSAGPGCGGGGGSAEPHASIVPPIPTGSMHDSKRTTPSPSVTPSSAMARWYARNESKREEEPASTAAVSQDMEKNREPSEGLRFSREIAAAAAAAAVEAVNTSAVVGSCSSSSSSFTSFSPSRSQQQQRQRPVDASSSSTRRNEEQQQSVQSRRPPVDAEVINAAWERRLREEKILHSTSTTAAAAAVPSTQSTTLDTDRSHRRPNADDDGGSSGSRVECGGDTFHRQPASTSGLNNATNTATATTATTATADADELMAAYRAKELEAMAARTALTDAESAHQRELTLVRRQLAEETAARVIAEQEVEEILPMMASTRMRASGNSPALDSFGGDINHSPQPPSSIANPGAANATTTTTDGGGAFWQKMREREDRARARARKEFIQDQQTKLYAEQDRRQEAEKIARESERRLAAAEERTQRHMASAREAQSLNDELKGTVSERDVRISELESQLSLLQRQWELAGEDKGKELRTLQGKIRDMEGLLAARDASLEEQRRFGRSLLQELGLKDRDLLDKDSIAAGVTKQVKAIQEQFQSQQRSRERAGQDQETALRQSLEHAAVNAAALTAHADDAVRRALTAEGDLARYKSDHSHATAEAAAQLQRLQGRMNDQQVEARSLELQLGQVSEVARRYAAEAAQRRERERQGQEAMTRRYEGEISSLREEVDRVALQRQRDKERHLEELLRMGREGGALKEQHARLEHAVNALEHERTRRANAININNAIGGGEEGRTSTSAAAAAAIIFAPLSLISGGGDETRDSHHHPRPSFHGPAGDGRMSIIIDSHITPQSPSRNDATIQQQQQQQQRIAELEAVRADLKSRLSESNALVYSLQQQQHQSGVMGSNSQADTTTATTTIVADLRQRQQTLQAEVRRLRQQRVGLMAAATASAQSTLHRGPSTNTNSSSGGGGVITAPVALAPPHQQQQLAIPTADTIYASLKTVVDLIEANTALRHHRGPSSSSSSPKQDHQQQQQQGIAAASPLPSPPRPTATTTTTSNSHAVNTVNNRQQFYFKPHERDVIDQVLHSCLAALDCLQANRSGDPYYSEGESSFSRGRGGEEEEEEEGDGGGGSPHHHRGGNRAAPRARASPAAWPGRNLSGGGVDVGDGRTVLESEPCWDRSGGGGGSNSSSCSAGGNDDDDDDSFYPQSGAASSGNRRHQLPQHPHPQPQQQAPQPILEVPCLSDDDGEIGAHFSHANTPGTANVDARHYTPQPLPQPHHQHQRQRQQRHSHPHEDSTGILRYSPIDWSPQPPPPSLPSPSIAGTPIVTAASGGHSNTNSYSGDDHRHGGPGLSTYRRYGPR